MIPVLNSCKNKCYEVKYLDFFYMDSVKVDSWTKEDLQKMKPFEQFVSANKNIKTSFIVPIIAKQLSNYHPSCNDVEKIDVETFDILEKLYFTVRGLNRDSISFSTFTDRIDFIRDDFYHQVNNEEYLPHMILAMGRAIYYGEDVKSMDNIVLIDNVKTDFGNITIGEKEGKVVITSFDKTGAIMWRKLISSSEGRFSSKISFKNEPFYKNSVSTNIFLYDEGDGADVVLYLKNNGEFMFYEYSLY